MERGKIKLRSELITNTSQPHSLHQLQYTVADDIESALSMNCNITNILYFSYDPYFFKFSMVQ